MISYIFEVSVVAFWNRTFGEEHIKIKGTLFEMLIHIRYHWQYYQFCTMSRMLNFTNKMVSHILPMEQKIFIHDTL